MGDGGGAEEEAHSRKRVGDAAPFVPATAPPTDLDTEEAALLRFREALPRAPLAAKNFVRHVLGRMDSDKDGYVRVFKWPWRRSLCVCSCCAASCAGRPVALLLSPFRGVGVRSVGLK